MPSIEIACVGLQHALAPPPLSFAVICERGLKSHRWPTPRFQRDFDQIDGCLYHLIDPDVLGRKTGACVAYELLSSGSREADPIHFLEFEDEHVASARALVNWLVAASPTGQILFTSDWQFGPDWTKRFDPITVGDFWRLHDSRALILNAAYPISIAV